MCGLSPIYLLKDPYLVWTDLSDSGVTEQPMARISEVAATRAEEAQIGSDMLCKQK